MLTPQSIAIASDYWSAHLGLPSAELFAQPFRLITHGQELSNYNGAFAISRHGSTILSVPAYRMTGLISGVIASSAPSPGEIVSALKSDASQIIGPAFIGYATTISSTDSTARALSPDDAPALESLHQTCDPTEWDHGGSTIDQPCSGVFVDHQLVALAGYEIWGGTIAHIAVITHPNFRGHGHARSAIAHLAQRAVSTGLLPQYRTLESNIASMQIARSLGFESFATSLAIRF